MAPSSGLGTDRMVSVLDTSLGLSSIQYLAIYTGGEADLAPMRDCKTDQTT